MAQMQFGCCEAKQASQDAEQCKRNLEVLLDEYQKTQDQIKATAFVCVVLGAAIIGVACAAVYSDEKHTERLQRLEKIVGMDEIGRRK